jgi:hypothetical protein
MIMTISSVLCHYNSGRGGSVVERPPHDRTVMGSNITRCHHVESLSKTLYPYKLLQSTQLKMGTGRSRDQMYIACVKYMYRYVHCMCDQACYWVIGPVGSELNKKRRKTHKTPFLGGRRPCPSSVMFIQKSMQVELYGLVSLAPRTSTMSRPINSLH